MRTVLLQWGLLLSLEVSVSEVVSGVFLQQMAQSSEESDISDSEVPEYEEKIYLRLKAGQFVVRNTDKTCRCPFCAGKKKQDYNYKDLLQHATGIGASNRKGKVKATHRALAKYLNNDMTDTTCSSEQLVVFQPMPSKSTSEDQFVWPWTGVVVNIPTEYKDGKYVGESGNRLKELLSKFHPLKVHPLWNHRGHTGNAIVDFTKDWTEIRKMQHLARDHSRKILAENEKLRSELDSKRQELEMRRNQLDKLVAQNDVDKRKLDAERQKAFLLSCIALLALSDAAVAPPPTAVTRHYKFDIQMANATRLCHTKSIVTVNGQFPGPKIVAREGDRVVVKVVNHVEHNVTLHWHGVRQLRSGWADGPAYVTQCPIQTGHSYVYNFTIVGQRGTFFWHAHISWLRATLYGPIVVLPRLGVPYPFAKPYKQVPVILGEWWKADTEAVINQALQTGGGPNVSDAYTINGLPGPFYNCSSKDTFKLKVKPGKTYLLRLINAALNDELFFGIANHTLTVVDVDAVYVKPFETDALLISPGQTTDVLLRTKPDCPNAMFFMSARPYVSGSGTFDNSTVAGVLEYRNPNSSSPASFSSKLPLHKPTLPSLNDTSFFANFTGKLRSLATARFPANVPQAVDRRVFFTVGLGSSPCPENQTCQGPNGTKFAATVNNVSFALPTTALLQAHFLGQSRGVYSPDFPVTPLMPFNYTGTPPNNTLVGNGTKLMVLPFNTSVELVMQDTSILGAESHPMHLHGFNFFVVGQGFGNYDPAKDPAKFNLVDPVERNTVGVPAGGWVVLRFLADNPGVWFMHCHLEVHTSWGLKMSWLVLDGSLPHQKLPPPPSDLPKC
ncbi:hypothetical protein BHE74_00019624 [Ensete ventricosum]|nr:hypothetical protein BHE74_00019624 [Ensete ventricosum]